MVVFVLAALPTLELARRRGMINGVLSDVTNTASSDFYCVRIKGGRKISHPSVWHSCFEIVWVRSGKVNIKIEDMEAELYEGDVVIIPQYALHSLYARGEDCSVDCFAYTERIVYSLGLSVVNAKYLAPFKYKTASPGCIIRAVSAVNEGLYERLGEVIAEYESSDFGRDLLVRAKILAAHACICDHYITVSGVGESVNTYLSSAEMYIENRISESISPYDIAASLQISHSHLSRIVDFCLGCTTSELISRVKMRYAEKHMLIRGKANVADVAARLGYKSPAAFNRAFGRIRGCTPAAFKKMYMPYDRVLPDD